MSNNLPAPIKMPDNRCTFAFSALVMNTAFSIFWLFVHIWRQSLVLQRTATIGLLAKREGKQMENLVSAS